MGARFAGYAQYSKNISLPLRPCQLLLYWFLITALLGCQSSPRLIQAPNPEPLVPTPSSTMIRLAIGEWRPYTGDEIPHHGCDAWIVSEAFALEGIAVEYGVFPWARSFQLAADGDWDGTLDWADTPAHREKFFLSADTLSNQELVFFHLADQPLEWSELQDFRGKTIGLTSGYAYGDFFIDPEQTQGIVFEDASSDLANFRKLLAGRIDAFPMERLVGESLLQDFFTEEERRLITYHPRSLADFEPYLLLSRQNPQNEKNIALFDQGFETLKSTGRYTQILESCFP